MISFRRNVLSAYYLYALTENQSRSNYAILRCALSHLFVFKDMSAAYLLFKKTFENGVPYDLSTLDRHFFSGENGQNNFLELGNLFRNYDKKHLLYTVHK